MQDNNLSLEDKGKGIYVARPHHNRVYGFDDYSLKGFSERLIDHLASSDPRHVFIDLKDIERMGSDDVLEIVKAYKLLNKAGAKVYFSGKENHIKILEWVGLTKFAEKVQSIDEKVAELLSQ